MIEDNNVEIDAIIEDDSVNLETDLDYRGERGPVGETPDITIGKVDTLSPEDNAYVEKEGTKENITLNFGIPKGETGDIGPVGPIGPSGVYIGSDEPQDPEVDVWIDPTVNPENYVKEKELDDKLNSMIESGELIGPQGPQGVPGKNGTDGTDGVGITTITSGQPTIEEDKTVTPVTVQKTDGSSQIFNVEAKNGIDGQNGKDGTNGQDGLTPTIGDNGNWYLGDTDTGKPSRGEVGPSPNLSNYVKNTDYASASKAGVLKINGNAARISSDGVLSAAEVSEEQYKTTVNSIFISKGTLDNVKNFLVESSTPVQDLTATVTNVQKDQDESMPKQTASGEIVSLDDAIAYKTFNVTVDGASEQETTTGKNLLPYPYVDTTKTENGITFTDNGDGTITVNGTATAGTFFKVFATQTNQKEIPGNYISGSVTGCNIVVAHREDSKYTSLGISTNGNSSLINKGLYDIGYVELSILQGVTLNNVIVRPMLTLEQDTSYEPYTGGQPSPSPDYPQEITTLTFDKITRCGKNLLPNNLASQTINGISVIVNDDKSITVNGTAEKRTVFYLYSRNNNEIDYMLPKGIDFILKGPRLEGVGINFQLGLYEPNKNEEYITANGKNDRQFKLDNYKIVNYFALIVEEGQTVDLTCYPQLEIGTQSTNYEPYQGQTYDIDLQGNEMVEIPKGVKNQLIIDKKGGVSLIKNIEKIILDGSIDFLPFLENTNTGVNKYGNVLFVNYRILQEKPAVKPYTKYPSVISNYFKEIEENIWVGEKVAIDVDNYQLILVVPQTLATTSDEFRAWLQEHNVIVYYQLATPEVIPLGNLTDLITTEEGSNTFFINGNLETTLEVLYALDTKKYIDNKLAEISSALIKEG